MCGIYGAVHRDPASVLPRMGETLVHRGPDGNGIAVRGRGGLGCRRLAIIDIEGGAQPIAGDLPRLRRDVDDAADLVDAISIGVGAHTAVVVAGLRAEIT